MSNIGEISMGMFGSKKINSLNHSARNEEFTLENISDEADITYLFTDINDYTNAVADNPNVEIVDLNINDPESFGYYSEKSPKQVNLNTLLSRVSLNCNTRILTNEFNIANLYHRDREAVDAARIQHLNHYVLKEVEDAYKILIQLRNENRRTHYRNVFIVKRHTVSEKVVFNVLSNILHADIPFSDKVSTMLIVAGMLSSLDLYNCRQLFPTFVIGEYKQQFIVKDLGIEVNEFKGANQSLMMKVNYPTVYSAFENFILLKDEINKLEAGLYEQLENILNNMLSTTDLKDFVDSALVFYGKVTPHHRNTEFNRQIEESQKEMLDGVDKSPILAHQLNEELNAKTFLSAYKLNCHCHSHSDDWKLRILPQIINYTFGMLVK